MIETFIYSQNGAFIQFCPHFLLFFCMGVDFASCAMVAMDCHLFLAIANLYMEAFKYSALERAPLKPMMFKRYVDDTFLVWSHGRGKLQEFPGFLHNLHPNIKFPMEVEGGHYIFGWFGV